MTFHDSFLHAVDEQSPQQKAVVAEINQFTELSEGGASAEAQLAHRLHVQSCLRDFEHDTGHSNPAWIIATVRANALSAFGDLEGAIRLEREALGLTKTDLQRAKNHNNLADHFRKLACRRTDLSGKEECLAHAVENGLTAVTLTQGDNVGMGITLTMALHDQAQLLEMIARQADEQGKRPEASNCRTAAATKFSEADELFDAAIQGARLGEAGDIATAHLKFDADLRAMTRLPSVVEALAEVERAERRLAAKLSA